MRVFPFLITARRRCLAGVLTVLTLAGVIGDPSVVAQVAPVPLPADGFVKSDHPIVVELPTIRPDQAQAVTVTLTAPLVRRIIESSSLSDFGTP